MEDMGNSKLTEIAIDFPDGTKISMKKEEKQVVVEKLSTEREEKVDFSKETIEQREEGSEKNSKEEGNLVKSPMVGTFYAKPSPDSEAYVSVGKKVKKGDILCIIEAMKLMNEIESEFEGEIVEVLVKDGETVEYGKPLFVIK